MDIKIETKTEIGDDERESSWFSWFLGRFLPGKKLIARIIIAMLAVIAILAGSLFCGVETTMDPFELYKAVFAMLAV